MHYGEGGLLMAAVMAMGVLVFALTVGLALTVYATRPGRALRDPVAGGGRHVSEAEGMLEMRFAVGEIDAAELAQGRVALRQ